MSTIAERVAVEALAVNDSDTTDRPVRFTPVISEEGCPGYRVEWLATDAVTYIYLNASIRDGATMADDDDNTPNVFVYEGPEFAPYNDPPLCYLNLEGPNA